MQLHAMTSRSRVINVTSCLVIVWKKEQFAIGPLYLWLINNPSTFLGYLALAAKKRYLAKTTLIGDTDPCTLNQRDLSHVITELRLFK